MCAKKKLSKAEAKKLRNGKKFKEMRIYKCKECKYWHMTSEWRRSETL